LTWATDQILIRADRLHEDSRYNVHCETAVKSTLPGVSSHIHQARVNLVSTQARRTLIRELEARASLDENRWAAIVEEFCIRVLNAYRQGEPVIQMAAHVPSDSLSWRLEPFLEEGQATVFFGQGETGKTWVALLLGVALSAPTPVLGLNSEPGNVLYLDYETRPDDTWRRLDMITSGLGIAIPDGFYYRQMLQTLASDAETIQREVVEKNISLVVVDSAALAAMEPETSAGATAYFQALRSLKCTTLTIAHTEASGKQDRPFGSIFWRNIPRANFRFRSNSDAGAPELVVGIHQTKANNNRRTPDLGISLKFEDNHISFKRTSVMDVEELAEHQPLRARIAHLLKRGAKSSTEIAEELGHPAQLVRNALSNDHHKAFGIISGGPEKGKWGLLETETNP